MVFGLCYIIFCFLAFWVWCLVVSFVLCLRFLVFRFCLVFFVTRGGRRSSFLAFGCVCLVLMSSNVNNYMSGSTYVILLFWGFVRPPKLIIRWFKGRCKWWWLRSAMSDQDEPKTNSFANMQGLLSFFSKVMELSKSAWSTRFKIRGYFTVQVGFFLVFFFRSTWPGLSA